MACKSLEGWLGFHKVFIDLCLGFPERAFGEVCGLSRVAIYSHRGNAGSELVVFGH